MPHKKPPQPKPKVPKPSVTTTEKSGAYALGASMMLAIAVAYELWTQDVNILILNIFINKKMLNILIHKLFHISHFYSVEIYYNIYLDVQLK